MEVRKINSISNIKPAVKQQKLNSVSAVSFKAKPPTGSNMSKKFWLYLRKLADEMKDITEIKNALIAAIGTGVIAPLIILVSPGEGDKEDKDKKFIQAIRQPISGGLQIGFQVPATILIDREIDKLAYEKKIKFFKDDVIGDLVPTEKYIAKGVTKDEIKALEANFEKIVNGKSLRQELEAKIKYDYEQVGLEISDEKLAKEVSKKKEKFLRKKVATKKHTELSDLKIKHILENPKEYPKLANIKDIDLVTEDYKNLAKERFKADYKKLEKDANLSFFDKFARIMGFDTKKTKQLTDKQELFKKEKGLEILKEENPEIFKDKAKKLKNYIEAYEKKADKVFGNKKFVIALLVNLFMVTASCYALNWLHPRVNKFLEDRKAEKESKKLKVEVA